ncbi:MAG: hypothetical protein R3C32_13455 [Chloroflexota bacterium]
MERGLQPRGHVPAVLSGAIVALALVAQATEFGDGFVLSGLLILPVVCSWVWRRTCALAARTGMRRCA